MIHNADLQLVLDLVGVFVFALSGGLVAVRKRLDLVGVLVLAGVAGLGGGIMRDLVIGAVPPAGLSDWRLLLAAVVAGLATFALHPGFARVSRIVRILDAAGLAVFAVGGSLKAMSYGVTSITAILVGIMTAVGGGMARDLLAGQVPEVLRRELYAVPAALGSVFVVLAHQSGHLSTALIWIAVLLIFAVRVTAVVLDLNAPKPLRTGDNS